MWKNFRPSAESLQVQEPARTLSPSHYISDTNTSVKNLPVTATVKKVGQSQFYSSIPAKTSLSNSPSDEDEAGMCTFELETTTHTVIW